MYGNETIGSADAATASRNDQEFYSISGGDMLKNYSTYLVKPGRKGATGILELDFL